MRVAKDEQQGQMIGLFVSLLKRINVTDPTHGLCLSYAQEIAQLCVTLEPQAGVWVMIYDMMVVSCPNIPQALRIQPTIEMLPATPEPSLLFYGYNFRQVHRALALHLQTSGRPAAGPSQPASPPSVPEGTDPLPRSDAPPPAASQDRDSSACAGSGQTPGTAAGE